MNKEIENIIKKNLPEEKLVYKSMSENEDYENRGFNQALSQINTSLIADEVLKVVQQDIHDIIWNKDGSLVSHDISYIVSSVMHYFIKANLSPNKENK